jgi:hypothetical protein
MPIIVLQATFTADPDNTILGPSFNRDHYVFTDAGLPKSFVNVNGAVKGLQFSNAGLQVQLPFETPRVVLRAAAMAGKVTVTGKSAIGVPLVTVIVPNDAVIHTVNLLGTGIARVDFTGGSNEGILEMISMKVNAEPVP